MPVIRGVRAQQHRRRVRSRQSGDGLQRVGDDPGRAPRGPGGAFAESLADDHRGTRGRRDCGQECVQAADAGVSEPRALLLRPVDLDDRVININEHHPVVRGRRDDRSLTGEVDQHSGCDGIELADVPESERAKERPQRRGRIDRREQLPHPAVTQHRHVIDRIRARDHPGHQRSDLRPGVRDAC